ncbi:hypothetical protein SDC9_168829 [bioreactor metagenome]|uniref:Uncharacterized protein n=1 Tax=bioreactor metagenome TaxID=1076179 RepID=A0A645G681_9ZZZZ
MDSAQIQLYPMQARTRFRSSGRTARLTIVNVRHARKGDRAADYACRCQVYRWLRQQSEFADSIDWIRCCGFV